MMSHGRLYVSAALATVMALSAVPAAAQDPNPGNILTRSLDNMPREQGARMANQMAGDDVLVVEDEPAPEAAEPEGVYPEGMSIDDIGPRGVDLPANGGITDRAYDEDGDPITQAAAKLLDEAGVLGRQRKLSEAMILMDQRLRFNSKVEQLLVALGPDAEIEVAPGVYQSFEGTPAALRARIAYINLQQQLADTIGDVGKLPAPEDTGETRNVENLPVRDDGTGYQRMGGTAGQGDRSTDAGGDANSEARLERMLAEAEERLARREAEIREIAQEAEERAKEAAEDIEPPTEGIGAVSLREIYGAAGTYIAVVEVGGERQEVRIGDEIAGGLRITMIGSTFMELTEDGESTRISL